AWCQRGEDSRGAGVRQRASASPDAGAQLYFLASHRSEPTRSVTRRWPRLRSVGFVRGKAMVHGKRVVITGASRGIGRSLALAFGGAGATVGVSAGAGGDLEAVAAEIAAGGGRAVAVPCDVTDPVQVAGLRERVTAEVGGVDILVNNAGAAGSHKFLDHPDE